MLSPTCATLGRSSSPSSVENSMVTQALNRRMNSKSIMKEYDLSRSYEIRYPSTVHTQTINPLDPAVARNRYVVDQQIVGHGGNTRLIT